MASPGRQGRLPLLPQYVGVGQKKTTNACTFHLTWLICGATFLFVLSGADAPGGMSAVACDSKGIGPTTLKPTNQG